MKLYEAVGCRCMNGNVDRSIIFEVEEEDCMLAVSVIRSKNTEGDW